MHHSAFGGLFHFRILLCRIDSHSDRCVAGDIEAGTEHVEHTINAGYQCQPFERQTTDCRTIASMMRPAPGTPAVPMEASVPVRTIINI